MDTKCKSCDQSLLTAPLHRNYCADCTPIFGNAHHLTDKQIRLVKAWVAPEWVCMPATYNHQGFDSNVRLGGETVFLAQTVAPPPDRVYAFGPTSKLAVDALLTHLKQQNPLPNYVKFEPAEDGLPGFSVLLAWGRQLANEKDDWYDSRAESSSRIVAHSGTPIRATHELVLLFEDGMHGARSLQWKEAVTHTVDFKSITTGRFKRKYLKESLEGELPGLLRDAFHDLIILGHQEKRADGDNMYYRFERFAHRMLRELVRSGKRVRKFKTYKGSLFEEVSPHNLKRFFEELALVLEARDVSIMRLPAHALSTLVFAYIPEAYLRAIMNSVNSRVRYFRNKTVPSTGPTGEIAQAMRQTSLVVQGRLSNEYMTSKAPSHLVKDAMMHLEPNELINLMYLGELPTIVEELLDNADFTPATW